MSPSCAGPLLVSDPVFFYFVFDPALLYRGSIFFRVQSVNYEQECLEHGRYAEPSLPHDMAWGVVHHQKAESDKLSINLFAK